MHKRRSSHKPLSQYERYLTEQGNGAREDGLGLAAEGVVGEEFVWGGYTGYFQDSDEHVWEVVWNPEWSPDVR